MASKVAREGSQSSEAQFLRGERVDVGIDVHKKTYSVTVWSEQRQTVIFRWTQPADPAAPIARLRPFHQCIGRVVYEAGPTGYTLVRALRGNGFRADVIAPSRTPQAGGQEAKSDWLESRKLSMWSAKGLQSAVRVRTFAEDGDRQIFRTRADQVAKRRRVKQQIRSFWESI